MLSAVININAAVETSTRITNSFVEMRRFTASKAVLLERISAVELELHQSVAEYIAVRRHL